MNTSLKSRLFLNFKILVGALFIALAIFYVSKNPAIFQASVLSLQEIQVIQDNWRDIAYKNQPNLLDIFISSWVQSTSSLNFSLVFNPSIQIQTQTLSWQWQISITNIGSGFADFHITDIQNIDYSQSILLVSFSWSTQTNDYLIIESAEAITLDWDKKNLSIWNLGETKSHSK